MKQYTRVISGISVAGGILASTAILLVVLMILWDVLARGLFNHPFIYVYEITGYLMVFAGFLGAAYALKVGRHIKVDLLVRWLPSKVQSVFTVGTSLLALMFITVFTRYGIQLVWTSYTQGRTIGSALAPPAFLPQMLIPIGSLMLALQLTVRLFSTVASLLEKKGEPR